MNKNDFYDLFIKKFSFWEHLSDDEKQLICENTVSVHYKKGTIVHSDGDDCIGILLVKSGQLRTYMLSENGRDVTLSRLFSEDVCIFSAACVLKAITFDVFIDAEEDTEVLLINSAVFRQLSQENIYVECFGYELATARFSEIMQAMQQILFMGADKRLAIFLRDEIEKENKDEIKMTHEQIARYMGSAREVVSRTLKQFETKGIVELFRGGIRVIDKTKLQNIA